MNNLKKLREQSKLSQSQLAEILHTTQQTIYKYEKNISEPNIEMLKKMADFFETSVDYLVGYTNIPRRIEFTTEYSLNKDEKKMIENYRKLIPRVRKVINIIIDEYLMSR